MINAEDLPPIELACRLRNRTFSDTCSYCLELANSTLLAQDEPWDKLLAAVCAGYVAGVRHERQRQRQKATAGKQPAPENITGQELELLQAWRMIGDADRAYIFRFAKYMAKTAQKEKEPADAATRQQACTE